MSNQHRWKFSRIGGFDQALITSTEDLLNLEQLDQKLWAALSCPVKGLQLDEAMLAAIDTDADGRVRVPEIVAAVKWACSALKDPNLLLSSADSLNLSDFSEGELGLKLVASSKRNSGGPGQGRSNPHNPAGCAKPRGHSGQYPL